MKKKLRNVQLGDYICTGALAYAYQNASTDTESAGICGFCHNFQRFYFSDSQQVNVASLNDLFKYVCIGVHSVSQMHRPIRTADTHPSTYRYAFTYSYLTAQGPSSAPCNHQYSLGIQLIFDIGKSSHTHTHVIFNA